MTNAQPPPQHQFPPRPPPAPPPTHSRFAKVAITVLGLFAAAIVTQFVNLETHAAEVGGSVSRIQAQHFLEGYYATVVNPHTAKKAWQTMLTPEAQSNLAGGWPKFETFWKEWSKVEFDPVQPVGENTFKSEMTYVDLKGRPQSWRQQVWTLECGSAAKYVPFKSCPDGKVLLKDAYIATP